MVYFYDTKEWSSKDLPRHEFSSILFLFYFKSTYNNRHLHKAALQKFECTFIFSSLMCKRGRWQGKTPIPSAKIWEEPDSKGNLSSSEWHQNGIIIISFSTIVYFKVKHLPPRCVERMFIVSIIALITAV